MPRSSKNEIVGPLSDGSYKIYLTAPPVDGEANKKLLTLLSKKFRVAKSLITIVKGKNARNKVVEIEES